MLCLDTLASFTDSHLLRNGTLHSIPPESFLEIIIHLRAARMNGICRIMSLTQDQLPEIRYIRHTYPTLVPQGTLIILSEMKYLANLKQFTDLLQLFIFFLMLHDLCP
jgi:hypothetical protein